MREILLMSWEREAMKDTNASGRHLLETGERVLGHTIAVVVGLVFMIAGMGMGVTMVLLPIGVPLGIAGLLLFLWGFYFANPNKQTSGTETPPR